MLQHHHFGPEEERPLGLRARRGRLPSVRTGDPPSRRRLREYDDGTSHSHSGSSSSIFQLVSSILWRRMDPLNLLHVTENITDLPACLQPLILTLVSVDDEVQQVLHGILVQQSSSPTSWG